MSPDSPSPPPAPAAEGKPVLPESFSWDEATKEVREAAKWVIVTLGAVAAVIFGAGPLVTKPELSWADPAERVQMLWALGLAALSIGAIVFVIGNVQKVLVPSRITLARLPPELEQEVEAQPRTYLPGDVATVTEFIEHRLRWHAAAANYATEMESAERELAAATAAGDSAAEQELQSVIRQLQGLKETADANVAAAERVADNLLDQGRFVATHALAGRHPAVNLVAAVVAGIGGIGFHFALADPGEDDDEPASGDSTSAGEVAYLIRPDAGTPGRQLWDALALDQCVVQVPTEPADGGPAEPVQAEPPEARVAATVAAGTGENGDPWKVTTLELMPQCRSTTFSVENWLIRVEIPEPRVVLVEPSPTPSGTGTG